MSQSSASSSDTSSSSSIEFDPINLLLPADQRTDDPTTLASTQTAHDPTLITGQTPSITGPSDQHQQTSEYNLGSNSGLDNQTAGSVADGLDGRVKTNLPTTASRSWMSQRKGKAIHIDGDHPMIDETADGAEEGVVLADGASAQRIKELGQIEEQLSKLLQLAGEALSSLAPPLGDDGTSQASSVENFSKSIAEYFETLNKIQLGLRTSMSHMRASRISTHLLFEPAHYTIPQCPVGLGDLNSIRHLPNPRKRSDTTTTGTVDDVGKEMLSVASLVAERDAWKDLVESLEQIKLQNYSSS